MSNVSKFTSLDEISEQASLWISRIDRGLSEAEKQSLAAWLEDNATHRRVLTEMASLWDDMSVLNELSGLFPLKGSAQETRVRRVMNQARWSVAAGFMLMALAVGMMVDWSWMQAEPTHQLTQHTTTAIGEQKTVSLTDGSKVQLNTNTIINVDYSDGMRRIELVKGEAHFTVAHDSSRPFIVEAGDNTVTAVGTAFNMQYVSDKAFELVVTDGRVLVKERGASHSDDSALILGAKPLAQEGLLMFSGEKATVDGKVTERESLTENAIDDDLAWQQGMIVFKGESLDKVLQEIGRYTPIKFELGDAQLKDRRVAGYFKVGDINGLLFALKSSFSIDSQRLSENTILLTTAG